MEWIVATGITIGILGVIFAFLSYVYLSKKIHFRIEITKSMPHSLYIEIKNPIFTIGRARGSYPINFSKYRKWVEKLGAERVAILEVIDIAQKSRSKNYGTNLFQKFEEECKNLGADAILGISTERSIGFFRKNGCKVLEEDTYRGYYRNQPYAFKDIVWFVYIDTFIK